MRLGNQEIVGYAEAATFPHRGLAVVSEVAKDVPSTVAHELEHLFHMRYNSRKDKVHCGDRTCLMYEEEVGGNKTDKLCDRCSEQIGRKAVLFADSFDKKAVTPVNWHLKA